MRNIIDALTYTEPVAITAADIDEAVYLATEYNYMITEALNEPHLLRLAAHLKKLADAHKGPGNFGATFGRFGIRWDKVSSSNVKEYEFVTTKEIQAARKVLTGSGFVITTDNDWNFTRVFKNDGHEKLYINISGDEYATSRLWRDISATEAFNYIGAASHLIIINLNGVSEIDTYKIRNDRAAARAGMIPSSSDPHVGWNGEVTYGYDYEEYCKRVAKENQKRYKKIIASNKAKKNTNYEKINKMVKTCLDRMMAAVAKVQGDPIKYADSLWVMSNIIGKINGQRVYTGNYKRGNNGLAGEDGVLELFKEYTRAYAKIVSQQDSYASTYLEQYETKIEKAISYIDYYFAQLGV